MQPQADPFIVPPCDEEIEVLYQDQHLLLINKPSGLLTLSGKHPLNKDSVHFRLVKDFPTATMIHRLDFGTSGILIVALNKAVNAHIGKQFQAHPKGTCHFVRAHPKGTCHFVRAHPKGTCHFVRAHSVNKTYTAILHGIVVADSGCIDAPIAKDKPNFPLQKICFDTGKDAITHYNVVERLAGQSGAPDSTRVIFKPVSGRTHQLRIHSRELGHPILGCDLYAADEAFFMADRLMLHATSIEFDHPVTGQRINGFSPCPF